jgi:hypothetical protein
MERITRTRGGGELTASPEFKLKPARNDNAVDMSFYGYMDVPTFFRLRIFLIAEKLVSIPEHGKKSLENLSINDTELPYWIPSTLDLGECTVSQLNRILTELSKPGAPLSDVGKKLRRDVSAALRFKAASKEVHNIRMFPAMFSNYFRAFVRKNEWARGWIYRSVGNGPVRPVVITDVEFNPEIKASKKSGRDGCPATVNIKFYYRYWKVSNDRCSTEDSWEEIIVYESAVKGYTVEEFLANHEFYMETPELNAEWDKEWSHWFDIFTNNKGTYTKTRGVFEGENTKVTLSSPTTLVVASLDYSYFNNPSTRFSDVYNAQIYVVPDFKVPVYNIHEHEIGLVTAKGMTPYQFNTEARKYLILPEHHADLIDAIQQNFIDRMAEVAEEELRDEEGFVIEKTKKASDIFVNKTGGFLVLCVSSEPGTGKSSVAEAVANAMHRPLYRINFGHLLGHDMSIATIENRLKWCMEYADNLGMVPLLDEADVLVSKRNINNMRQYAIVAAALPILEYFSGLLFLTSNVADLDPAVVSRMAATIKFQNPTEPARLQMWRNQAKIQGMDLSEADCKELAKRIEGSGRLITRLVGLAVAYGSAKKTKPTKETIYNLSVFQGVELNEK